jgi:hypothetical protein
MQKEESGTKVLMNKIGKGGPEAYVSGPVVKEG